MNPFPFRESSRHRKDPERRDLRKPPLIAITLGLFLLIASPPWMQPVHADESLLRGPRKIVRTGMDATEPAAGHAGILEKIAAAPVLFYQRFLGPSWGHRCPSYPSCSNYALLAIRKHGAFLGSIMTFDRLQHEADEARYALPILAGGVQKIYDPLENNDYWWYIKRHSEAPAPTNTERLTTP